MKLFLEQSTRPAFLTAQNVQQFLSTQSTLWVGSSRTSPALLGKVLIKQSYKLYRFFLLALPSDLKLHNLLAHFFLQVCRHDSIFLYPIPDCRFLPVLLHHLHLEPAPENKSCIAWRGNAGENTQKWNAGTGNQPQQWLTHSMKCHPSIPELSTFPVSFPTQLATLGWSSKRIFSSNEQKSNFKPVPSHFSYYVQRKFKFCMDVIQIGKHCWAHVIFSKTKAKLKEN